MRNNRGVDDKFCLLEGVAESRQSFSFFSIFLSKQMSRSYLSLAETAPLQQSFLVESGRT